MILICILNKESDESNVTLLETIYMYTQNLMKIKGRYQHKQIRSFDNINQELRVSSKPPMNIVIYTFSSSLLQPQNV